MKRMAVLRHDATDEGKALLAQIREKLLAALERQGECYRNIIVPQLGKTGRSFAALGRADGRPA